MKPLTERINEMLAELRVIAKAEGVTPGEWRVGGCGTLIFVRNWCIGNMTSHEMVEEDCPIISEEEQEENAHFVAKSRTITPLIASLLIAAVEGLADIESTGAANKVWDATKGSKQAKNALTELCDKWEAGK